jgi:hypothetical protein
MMAVVRQGVKNRSRGAWWNDRGTATGSDEVSRIQEKQVDPKRVLCRPKQALAGRQSREAGEGVGGYRATKAIAGGRFSCRSLQSTRDGRRKRRSKRGSSFPTRAGQMKFRGGKEGGQRTMGEAGRGSEKQ